MGDIPESHPRRESLLSRQKLVDAASKGMLAESALIAHGRGEAFDYLLGEKTCDSARLAIMETAYRLLNSEKCVISVNGNTVALAGPQLIACAAVLGCPIEVNIYYRTPKRMEVLLSALMEQQQLALNLYPQIKNKITDVKILGGNPDGRIPNLEGPRANCHSDGILSADTILVPLEDGDRCEALIAMGKTVCVIDLNPLSRTAQMATVTIVDELTRCVPILLETLMQNSVKSLDWNNKENLENVIQEILRNFNK
ncbi:MAG: phosphopantothenate/pantothenate synthetase [Euryarchaeota archaeon]|nr:phosphopantothenate/pantothenate synthetase [Euryarchaeota archaeon]|tara:strand:+ start:1468 stop:2232 length:765 start_codon:yes stop_codon:yes gene_type:complete